MPAKAKKRTATWLADVLLDWSLIVCAIWLSYLSVAFWPVAWIVVGCRQHALAILGHDGAHWHVSANRKLNDLLTYALVFVPMGFDLIAYRKFHLAHHAHLGTRRDPEIYLKDRSRFYDLQRCKGRILLDAILVCFGAGIPQIVDFYRLLWREASSNARVIGVSLTAAMVLVVLGSMGLGWAAAVWLISLLTTNWAFFQLRVWTEHQGTSGTHRITANWWQRLLFLPHNTWLHWEHHKHPQVPYYNLPSARFGF